MSRMRYLATEQIAEWSCSLKKTRNEAAAAELLLLLLMLGSLKS